MVGLVIASHGDLAEALIRTAEGIVGPLPQARAVKVDAGASLEDCRAQVKDAIRSVDTGDGVLILTDVFGGTPSNLSLTCLEDPAPRIEVVTGVNLPMLLKLASCRADGLALGPTAQLIAGTGQKNICCASELLRERARNTGSHR